MPARGPRRRAIIAAIPVAAGPWSNRHTSGPDLMARFTPLDPVARIAWRKRLGR